MKRNVRKNAKTSSQSGAGMKKLKVDIDQLMWAFENAARESDLFLNVQTGELISEEELSGEEETIESLPEGLGEDSHLIRVPEADPGSGFEDMEDFIRTVADATCQRELERALAGSHPFRRFKDTLHFYPSERDRWFKFKENLMKNRVLEWLRESGIDPVEDTANGSIDNR